MRRRSGSNPFDTRMVRHEFQAACMKDHREEAFLGAARRRSGCFWGAVPEVPAGPRRDRASSDIPWITSPYVMVITVIAMLICVAPALRCTDGCWAVPFWAQALAFVVGTITGAAWRLDGSRVQLYLQQLRRSLSRKKWRPGLEKLGEAAEVYKSRWPSRTTFNSAWTMMAAWSVLYSRHQVLPGFSGGQRKRAEIRRHGP